MSDTETVIVAHKLNDYPKRAFKTWKDARAWNDAVSDVEGKYTLSETLVVEIPEVEA